MARLTELPSSSAPAASTSSSSSSSSSPPPAQAAPAPPTKTTKPNLTPALSEAESLKTRANALFDAKRYDGAIALYADAVAALPPRRGLSDEDKAAIAKGENGEDDQGEGSAGGASTTTPPKPRLEDEEFTALRTACYANTAAAYLRMEMWEQAREAASQALTDTPNHVKALHRRAQATEALAKRLIAARQGSQAARGRNGQGQDEDAASSSFLPLDEPKSTTVPPSDPYSLETSASSLLTSTESDLAQLLAQASLPPSLRPSIEQSLARVRRDLEAERERDKEEVLGKLKDMGDKVLGWFGMSMDQFKVDKGPGGGMSLRFGG